MEPIELYTQIISEFDIEDSRLWRILYDTSVIDEWRFSKMYFDRLMCCETIYDKIVIYIDCIRHNLIDVYPFKLEPELADNYIKFLVEINGNIPKIKEETQLTLFFT